MSPAMAIVPTIAIPASGMLCSAVPASRPSASRTRHAVNKSRTGKLTSPIDDIANGKAYTAKEAKDLGLIDEIGYLDKAVAWAQSKAGLSRPTIVKYDEKVSFIDRFPFAQAGGSPRAQSVTVNGMNVDVDRDFLEHLTNPRPLYLWRR